MNAAALVGSIQFLVLVCAVIWIRKLPTADALSTKTTPKTARPQPLSPESSPPPVQPQPETRRVKLSPGRRRLFKYTGADVEAWRAGYTTCPRECPPTILSCPSAGGLPNDFPRGTYFRNGHGRFSSDDGSVTTPHMFDGDGLLLASTFDPDRNRILFRNSFVETAGYLEDKSTGKMSKRGVFGTLRTGGVLANAFRTDFKNVANTNVLYAPASDKLFALWEAGRPHVVDPLTLKCTGASPGEEDDLGGLLREEAGKEFSAHPRYDPRTNTVVNFGNGFDASSGKTTVRLYELDADTFEPTEDTVRREVSFMFEGAGLMHDFVITENWHAFAVNAAKLDPVNGVKALLGLGPFAGALKMEEQDCTYFVLVPRRKDLDDNGASTENMDMWNDPRIKVIPVPFHFNFHFANAYEDEDTGEVVLDSVQTTTAELGMDLVNEALSENRGLWDAEPLIFDDVFPTQMVRYTLDPSVQRLSADNPPRVLESCRNDEFPVVPRQLSSRKHRYAYTVGSHRPLEDDNGRARGAGPHGSVVKVDSLRDDDKNHEVYVFEPHEFAGEVAFVPKVGADVTDPTQEDRGYLVLYVTNGRDRTTDLVVLDVEGEGSLERGPVCRVRLPVFVPHGLHGCFAEGATFDFEKTEEEEASQAATDR